MRNLLTAIFLLTVVHASTAASLAGISNPEAVSGLKQALSDGSAAAVAKLGVENGFLGNAKIKIGRAHV